MLATVGSIVLKYWIEFLLGLIVAGGGFFLKRYLKLERTERNRAQDEHYKKLTENIKEENAAMIQALSEKYKELDKEIDEKYDDVTATVQEALARGREESKFDDAQLQNQITVVSGELNALKAGLLSIQGKEFRDNCRKLLEPEHIITIDEWEELDADHEAYNGLGGNHKGDNLFDLVKKKFENTL